MMWSRVLSGRLDRGTELKNLLKRSSRSRRVCRFGFCSLAVEACMREVEKQLESETRAGRVIFTGAVAHDRVPALLDACDILVAPHVPLG